LPPDYRLLARPDAVLIQLSLEEEAFTAVAEPVN
jgi:hypothetical protein